MNNSKIRLKYCLLSGLIPLSVLLGIFVFKSITPFGNNSLLYADLQSQYSVFYTELCDKIKHGENLFLNLNRSLGTDYISEIAYYCASPFIVICMLFDSSSMPAAISLMVLIKCALAGLFCYIYFKKHYKRFEHEIFFVSLSTCYALCSYFVNYYGNIMWLDGFLVFPLIIWGLERIYEEKKFCLYTLSLSYAIITNFYVGFMICIFCCIYFLYLSFINYTNFKNFAVNSLRFAVFSFISGGLSAFILLPTAYNLQFSEPSSYGMFEKVRMFYKPIISIFRQQLLAKPTFMHDPYIYSSVLAILILPVFILQKSIPLKHRIGKILIYILLLESFRFSVLDYLWNGFHHVNCLAARQSFIFIFVALTIIADVLTSKLPEKKVLFYSYLVSTILCSLSILELDYTSVMLSSIYSIIAITIYLIAIHLIPKWSIKYTYFILAMLMILESGVNAYATINNFTQCKEFTDNINTSKELVNRINDSSFYRVKNDAKLSFNSSSLGNYKAISNYSSMQNFDSLMFLYNIGYPVYVNTIDDISYEPVFLSILGVKYICTENKYTGAYGLSLIDKTEDNYLYRNTYALSPGFVLPEEIKDFEFTHNSNPFEQINDFASKIADVGNIYESIYPDGDTLSVEPGTQLFIYNKSSGLNQTFVSEDGEEEIFSTHKNGLYMHRKGIDDNYIYYVYSSPKGGYIHFDSSDKATELIAYTLNSNNYDKFMTHLSENQMTVNSHSQNVLSGEINSHQNGIIMTSLAYNKGYKVYVDEKKVDTYSVSDALLAFDVESGTHKITIHYTSYGFIPGTVISVLSLLLLLTFYIISHKK